MNIRRFCIFSHKRADTLTKQLVKHMLLVNNIFEVKTCQDQITIVYVQNIEGDA